MAEKMALTVAEAAHELGISRNSVYLEIKEGRLPYRRTGSGDKGRILISRAVLDEWLKGEQKAVS